MKTNQFRDLTILELSPEVNLAIACDSSASIGEKEHDIVKVDPGVTAACCLRVPLFELICVGSKPISIVDVIGNELEPTGKKMIAGIKREMRKAGLEDIPLNGSTEENMTTSMSSLGITVTGQFVEGFIKPEIRADDYLFQLGEPLVGPEVVANLDSLCSYSELYQLKSETGVVDLLPVGSKGMKYEGQLMASENELSIVFHRPDERQLQQSAGPSTVVLVAVSAKLKSEVVKKHPHLIEIGQFKHV